jgi:hypothetical protein
MFWLGVIIALVAGLVSIELSRDAVRRRYPAIKQYHLDAAALAFLVVGLALSAVEHYKSESELASLEAQLTRVRAFEARIRARARANWLGGSPPGVTAVVVDQSKPIAQFTIRTKNAGARPLDLLPTATPRLSPVDAEVTELILHVRPDPGSWLFQLQRSDLTSITHVEFGAWGLTRSTTRDGRMQVLVADVQVFVNGERLVHIEKGGGPPFDLPEQPDRYGSLSWDDEHQFKPDA